MNEYIIIGAGIIGLSIAYELKSRKDVGKVTILSKDVKGSNKTASVLSGGAYRFWHSNPQFTEWVIGSDQVIEKWNKSFDVPYYRVGLSWKADKSTLLPMESRLLEYQIPFVEGSNALVETSGGYFDTVQMIQSLHHELEKMDVSIIENCSVYDLFEGTEYVKVNTSKGLFESKQVVIAAGHQSYQFHPDLIPLIGHVEYAPILIGKRPNHFNSSVTIDINENLMVIPYQDYVKVACGNSIKSTRFSLADLNEATQFISKRYMRLTGEPLEIFSSAVGVYDNTSDHFPVVGYVTNRLYVACGFNGTGFKFGPFIGSAVADELAENSRHPNLKAMSPDRTTIEASLGV